MYDDIQWLIFLWVCYIICRNFHLILINIAIKCCIKKYTKPRELDEVQKNRVSEKITRQNVKVKLIQLMTFMRLGSVYIRCN